MAKPKKTAAGRGAEIAGTDLEAARKVEGLHAAGGREGKGRGRIGGALINLAIVAGDGEADAGFCLALRIHLGVGGQGAETLACAGRHI